MIRKRTASGTTLIEILVVIVVFLVGILAIVQVFPGGFRVLNITRNNTAASALARAMIEQLKGRSDQLPDGILNVRYRVAGGRIIIEAEPERYPGDLGPPYADLRNTGVLHDTSGVAIGSWQYLSGANVARRVMGEGKVIPTPKQVGSEFGSLLVLQFAPIVFNPASVYDSIFVVYGNDLTRRDGDPIAAGIPVRDYEYFIDQDETSSANITFATQTRNISYRVNLTAYVNTVSGLDRRDIVDLVVPIAASPTRFPEQVAISDPTLGILAAGETLHSIEYDSVRVARAFDEVANSSAFSDDPYEYVLMSPQLGLVLLNPKGYNFSIRRSGGRRDPLVGRVSYDVYDWRIIREEFRAPDYTPAQYKLALGSLAVSGENGADGRRSTGMGFSVPDAAGNPQSIDLVLQDTDLGGTYVYDPTNPGDPTPSPTTLNDVNIDPTRSSYYVNKSAGTIRLLDYDRNPANGTQMMLMIPGETTPRIVTADNRNLRAMYQAKGEWAVQVMKPASRYSRTFGRPGIAQFNVGNGSATESKIYFAPAYAGRVVSLGEVYYVTTTGALKGPEQLTATIVATPADPLNLPYVRVADFFPDFAQWDESYGSAVKSIKGASVAVRVLWNPDRFWLGPDSAENLSNFDKWMQGWRRSTVETYLQKGEN